MTPRISVILCTHNPNADRLTRTLQGLATQTLPPEQWELVIVDNRSSPPVRERTDFPKGLAPTRLIDEPELGLTPARLCGIHAAKGDTLIFVDDDNVLEPTYLREALTLLDREPTVGAAGGIIEGHYESAPPAWALPYLNLLGIRDFGPRSMRALVFDMVGPWEPIGAGLVIRKSIAEHYSALASDPIRRSLDRRGASLGSCGDTDMVRCAPEMGFYLAYQPSLRLTHLIPAFRLRYGYMLRLVRALKRTGVLLDRVRTGHPTALTSPISAWLHLLPEAVRLFTPSWRLWVLRMAAKAGEIEGRLMKLEAKDRM